MNLFKDQNKRREIIMKHYSTPNNKRSEIQGATTDVYSKVCVDELHLVLDIEDNIIKDAFFKGIGCAVFLSSVDIMLDQIKGKTVEEVKKIIDNYNNMIHQKGSYDEEILGELLVFENVASHLNRLHCAEMIFIGIDKNLK